MFVFIALIVVVFGLWLLMPWLKRRAQRMMLNKMEDMMRSAAGMPPRDKKKKTESRGRRREAADGWHDAPRARRHSSGREPLIPKEYAVDVEFTEYKDFSSTASDTGREDAVQWHQEEQVSDVQWVEIKDKQ